MANSPITTHVLDTALGKPAVGVSIVLERATDTGYEEVAQGVTDADGRVAGLITDDAFITGQYLIHFDTGAYFHAAGRETFYPEVAVLFTIKDPEAHYHIPLLLSPFGYSTYRGSYPPRNPAPRPPGPPRNLGTSEPSSKPLWNLWKLSCVCGSCFRVGHVSGANRFAR